jgi:cytochrome c oxidase subunit 4
LALTAITVGAAGMDFGAGNTAIAPAIASVKASQVALFFMHLRREKPMNAIIFVCGLLLLGVFLALCAIDLDTRDAIRPANPPRTAAASRS